VVFLCHDGDGRFVMAKRSERARDERGRWDIGGGAIEFGQTAEEALAAEIRQEYNGTVERSTFLGYRDVIREQAHWLALDFAVLVDPATIRNNEPHKFDDMGWFHLATLPSPVHPGVPGFFARYPDALARQGIRQRPSRA
jgi:8-oxo-dGTP pyrophosphatase MutT (NUDIX family)